MAAWVVFLLFMHNVSSLNCTPKWPATLLPYQKTLLCFVDDN